MHPHRGDAETGASILRRYFGEDMNRPAPPKL